MKNIVITIDGPAASGKGKIAKYLSKKWKIKHIDSGILYRKIALSLLNSKIEIKDKRSIEKHTANLEINTYRNDNKLRNEKISKIASKIAIHKFIRNKVNKFQKKYVYDNLKNIGFVIDGRDIGSVVFKKADLKLYIDVSEINRAKRRYKQLIDSGEKSIYPKILKEIKLRDKNDKSRKNSPLVIPKGAKIINNNYTFRHTVAQINKIFDRN